jgi:hypothetical protein
MRSNQRRFTITNTRIAFAKKCFQITQNKKPKRSPDMEMAAANLLKNQRC